MTTINDQEYMAQFEASVLRKMKPSYEMIPVRKGKLSGTRFGRFIGNMVETDALLVIDYYGHHKKSRGFHIFTKHEQSLLVNRQVKMIKGPVVHFASIRIEDVARYAPKLVADFPYFKQFLLELRGFAKKSSTVDGGSPVL